MPQETRGERLGGTARRSNDTGERSPPWGTMSTFEPLSAQGTVEPENFRGIRKLFGLRLNIDHPGRLVIVNEGDVTNGRSFSGKQVKFLTDLVDLSTSGIRFTIGQVEAGMVLFLPERCLPPTKITHHFGAVSKGLQRPETHHAGKRGRIVRSPVDRSRLLFHYPPATPTAGAIEVVVKRSEVRIT